ncbi:sugar phosphate isomerase/epimerase family protein [Blastopirellula marina]|uniref:Xylose isomerase-like TIM barrel domain-containing protein n=1 Tax=Blastopirellula marina DSM 3645 TaxID=314230 RepID=A3ZMT7_9BACT|nr:TIM barrel protein [Blastopirellula marina]EAQ82263.1 hypothetical protein DSM3645_01075 [Blastopirellula marina DSM 3645]
MYEALEKTAATGLPYLELFAWQKLSPDHPDAQPTAGLSATLQKDWKKKAADLGVKIIGIYSKLENPDSAKAMFEFAAMQSRSERMGFCCDTGHWRRSGLDPVEMLQKIVPRVKTFHLKDLDQFGVPRAKDVVWGQGAGRIAWILAEIERLDIQRPYFSIEWERDPNESIQTHAKSVAFLEQIACTYRM